MLDVFRDAFVGQCLRLAGCKSYFPYPEELCDYNLPEKYASSSPMTQSPRSSQLDSPEEKDIGKIEEGNFQQKDTILVTWHGDNDPDNPHNWSNYKKGWISMVILVYTFSAYVGSSLYTASEPQVASVFHVSDVAASLGLSLYVIGYGVGPLLWSPISEIPAVGRNPPYNITFALFVILCVPTALVNNFAGLLVLRLLLGFLCSPCLATAAATLGDVFSPSKMSYVLAFWGCGATLSPCLGPLIAGFAVQKEGWRWSTWELLWLSGPVLLLMLFTLPETSADAILYQRAKRLRIVTGRDDLRSESEFKQANMSARQITFGTLVKPWEINALDPAVLFSTFYTALAYAIFYSFFESFPLVYEGIYGFNLGELGLAFIAVLVGLLISLVTYCMYFRFIFDPWMAKQKNPMAVPPEVRLWPGLIATFFLPVGLFIFAWTSRQSVFWIVSMLGIAISVFGLFIIVQCMFIYLPFTYPQYAGSLFAANGFARATFAAGAILFSQPMFYRLGVSGGVSLLAGLTVLCCAGIYGLYFYGAALRKRSRFAVS